MCLIKEEAKSNINATIVLNNNQWLSTCDKWVRKGFFLTYTSMCVLLVAQKSLFNLSQYTVQQLNSGMFKGIKTARLHIL